MSSPTYNGKVKPISNPNLMENGAVNIKPSRAWMVWVVLDLAMWVVLIMVLAVPNTFMGYTDLLFIVVGSLGIRFYMYKRATDFSPLHWSKSIETDQEVLQDFEAMTQNTVDCMLYTECGKDSGDNYVKTYEANVEVPYKACIDTTRNLDGIGDLLNQYSVSLVHANVVVKHLPNFDDKLKAAWTKEKDVCLNQHRAQYMDVSIEKECLSFPYLATATSLESDQSVLMNATLFWISLVLHCTSLHMVLAFGLNPAVLTVYFEKYIGDEIPENRMAQAQAQGQVETKTQTDYLAIGIVSAQPVTNGCQVCFTPRQPDAEVCAKCLNPYVGQFQG